MSDHFQTLIDLVQKQKLRILDQFSIITTEQDQFIDNHYKTPKFISPGSFNPTNGFPQAPGNGFGNPAPVGFPSQQPVAIDKNEHAMNAILSFTKRMAYLNAVLKDFNDIEKNKDILDKGIIMGYFENTANARISHVFVTTIDPTKLMQFLFPSLSEHMTGSYDSAGEKEEKIIWSEIAFSTINQYRNFQTNRENKFSHEFIVFVNVNSNKCTSSSSYRFDMTALELKQQIIQAITKPKADEDGSLPV